MQSTSSGQHAVSQPPQEFLHQLEAFPTSVLLLRHGTLGYREAPGPRCGATPVVLLHGMNCGSASWVGQLGRLSCKRRTVAWEIPGYGKSSPVRPRFPGASSYAGVLAESLDLLGIGSCILVGHSLGAIIATALAVEQPERVVGLLLISPLNGYAASDPEVRIAKRDLRLAVLEQLGPGGLAREKSCNMMSPAACEEARAWVRWNIARIIPSGYRQATHLLANSDLVGDLRRFSGSVHVTVGQDDLITPPAACENIAHAAHACLQIVPRAGHVGYVECPDAYAAIIERFCRRCEEQTQRIEKQDSWRLGSAALKRENAMSLVPI